MKVLKTIFHFYIESSIHVALAICALAGVTVINYNLQWEWPVFAFLFFASISGYNFVKYAGVAKLHHRSLTNQLKTIQIFSLICFIILLYTISLQSLALLKTTAILGVFTFFYAIPFLPNQQNLRQLKSVKIFVIALVWAGATIWIPAVDQLPLLSWSVLCKTLSYFAFVLALILPFEIRDLQFDNPELGTLPQRFGIAKTKRFGYIMLLLFIGLNCLQPAATTSSIISSISIAIAIALFTHFSVKKQAKYYASFWVEAVPIYWFISLWLINR